MFARTFDFDFGSGRERRREVSDGSVFYGVDGLRSVGEGQHEHSETEGVSFACV